MAIFRFSSQMISARAAGGGCPIPHEAQRLSSASSTGRSNRSSLPGANPKRALDEDMLRLKSLLERGKTVAHGAEVTREELRH